jgi:uncharacterized protein (DUF58 family)
MGEPLLDARLLARLERLQLGTRRRLAGRMSGDHRSPDRGTSLDFAEYREYSPGDDFRRVDYQAMARLDQLLVRLYQAEDDITVRLLIDTSASMGYGGKLRQACRVAAALGFVALVRRDPVVVHTFPAPTLAPRFHGRHASAALMRHLDALTPSGGTPFLSAASNLLQRPGPVGLTVVISDLLTDDWTEGLRRLPARGAEVVVVHVLSEEDLHPTFIGDVDLVDGESGRVVPISVTRSMMDSYEKRAAAWVDDVAGRARHSGASVMRLMANDDLESALLRGWREAGVVR